jgi:class 3 adenylate cyclase
LLNGRQSADIDLPTGASLSVTVDRERIQARVLPIDTDASLQVDSTLDQPTVLMLERAGEDGTAVLGSVIASFPDFLDLFATEAPATGVELSIAHLALLFSDLTGSTALYQSVGDARAFAIVQDHFRDMTEVVTAHGGAIVKTMGDAVMATFPSEVDAIKSAIAMTQRCRDHHGAQGLGAKLGVYAGACLAVRANERLDFFGTTVNLAARLQAQAEGGQLVLTAEQAQQAEVQPLLASFKQSPFKAHLKGIATEQDLIAIDVCPR